MTDTLSWLNATLNFPLSGGVTQRIAPVFEIAGYRGEARIEERVLTDVAGYGSQLGTMLDALCHLAPETDPAFDKLRAIKTQIDALKETVKVNHERTAAEALDRLRESDPVRWRALIAAQAAL